MAKKKILIVDDEQDVLIALEARLVNDGYDVIKANNGQEAVFSAQREKPDLILLDIMMPVMDGSKTAQKLHDDPATRDIPIMFLTCLVTPEEERHGLNEVGGHFFVAKPYNPHELLSEIKKRIT